MTSRRVAAKPARRTKAADRPLPRSLAVRVRYDGSQYMARARGLSATCAFSDAEAVRRIAQKLGYAPGFDVVMGDRGEEGVRIWRIVVPQ